MKHDKGFFEIFKLIISRIYYNNMSLDEKKNYELNQIQSQISNDSGQIN